MGILASAPSASAGARRIDRRDRLVAEGVASVADIDTAISVVPGLRWALMGPHLTFHLAGGVGGIDHFLDQFAAPMADWWKTLGKRRPVRDWPVFVGERPQLLLMRFWLVGLEPAETRGYFRPALSASRSTRKRSRLAANSAMLRPVVSAAMPSARRSCSSEVSVGSRSSHRPSAFAQVEFATNSPLEGTGFELLVRGRSEAGCRAP